jgi:O-antigen biosynthesis protein
MRIALSDPPDPLISVVMVTHGAWPCTEHALRSLVEHTHEPFELIAVDNDSRDETPERLVGLRNVRVIWNDKNRGFGPASNQGVAMARGELLVLLNTDAFVHAGWLPPLLETISDPGVGAVVPRYLHLDGRLQEAGALLAQDGSVMTYGDGDDPERIAYRFRRVVDFGGAACMLMRRSSFVEVGGFDPVYAPAYYEDVDLCLRLASLGQSTVYDPRSVVTHVRYGSGGEDRAIQASRRSQTAFLERWGTRLSARPWTFHGTSEQSVITARDACATPRVLVCAGDELGGRAARALLARWPTARVTWTCGKPLPAGIDAADWLRAGVELIDDSEAQWLNQRRFLYDFVVMGSEPPAGLAAGIAATQPQAPWIALSALEGLATDGGLGERAQELLSASGIAPPFA